MHRIIRYRIAAFTLLLAVLAPQSALAAAGETGFAFLKLGVGARAMGMGSAYVALADDPTAVYWNPAGLASIKGAEVSLMHNEWIEDFRQEFAAVSTPLLGGALGFGFSGFYTSELERRDETGVLTGHFGFNDISASANYARILGSKFAGGVGIKYIREMIDQEDATTVAFDLGGRYFDAGSGLSAGAAIQNLGGDAKFDQEGFSLPTTMRGGVALTRDVSRWQGRGVLSAEVNKSSKDDARFHVGGEFEYKERVALRVGAKFGYDDQDLSFGLGVKQKGIGFDYALVPFSSNLGTTHFFSLNLRL